MKRFLTLVLSAAVLGTGGTLSTVAAVGTAQAAAATQSMPGMKMAGPHPSSTAGPVSPPLGLRQGWVAAAPPGAEELSAYLVLSNPGKVALTLIGVSAPFAGQAMLMSTGKDSAGRETMRMSAGMNLPAGGQLKLLPGQAHLMFTALRRQPQPSETVPVTLTFSNGSFTRLTLPIRKLP